MTRTRWLLVIAVAGGALFALSFANAWVVHAREVRGEGYRYADYLLSAWRGPGMGVLAIGAVTALVTALYAAAALLRPSLPAWPLVVGSLAVVALTIATAVPVSQDGHASSVDLRPGLLLGIGLVLAVAMAVAAFAIAPPARNLLIGLAAASLGVLLVGAGGRWWALQAEEGTGRHWSEGSYTRAATGGEPTETLTIGDGNYAIADRWSGTWEWSGWTVVLTGDPACPDARGTYHARSDGEEDLRFVKVVDTCGDGERAADLETGIWARDE